MCLYLSSEAKFKTQAGKDPLPARRTGSLLLGDGTQAAYNALAFDYLLGLADRYNCSRSSTCSMGDITGWKMATAMKKQQRKSRIKSLMKNTVASVILKGEKKWETADWACNQMGL